MEQKSRSEREILRRQHISESLRGKPKSSRVKIMMSESRRGEDNPNYGNRFEHSSESIEKMKTSTIESWRRGDYEHRPPPRPVRWNGRLYRSRSEIDVQVCLDDLGVLSQYEPRRFDLGDCTYSPDFYLSEYDVWIEVKGRWWNELDEYKVSRFRELECGTLYLLFGDDYLRQLAELLESLLS